MFCHRKSGILVKKMKGNTTFIYLKATIFFTRIHKEFVQDKSILILRINFREEKLVKDIIYKGYLIATTNFIW